MPKTAMLHRPEILFLDEPTIKLDAVSKLAVRKFIKTLNKTHSVTTILTTHDMDDIEALCDRIMIIGGGEIMSDGSLAKLRAQVSSRRYLKIDLKRDDFGNSFRMGVFANRNSQVPTAN